MFLKVGGNWLDTGTYTKGTETVTFDGTTGTQDVTSTGSSFHNVHLDGLGAAVTFIDSAVISNGLTVDAADYAVTFSGAINTIAGDTNFLNTGTTTIGDESTDSSTFTGGLVATTGTVNIAGTVATTNTAMTLGATTVSDDSTINPASGEGSLAAVTINDAKTLIVTTGSTGAISFGSTINSAVGGAGNLTINTDGTATFSGNVGGTTTAIGTLNLTAGNVSPGEIIISIRAGTIAVNGGTSGLIIPDPNALW
jgi:hypothetical protein